MFFGGRIFFFLLNTFLESSSKLLDNNICFVLCYAIYFSILKQLAEIHDTICKPAVNK